MFLGSCLMLLSVLGALQQVTALERLEDEQHRTHLAATVWRDVVPSSGVRELDLGPWSLPPEGMLRVTACVPGRRAPIELVVRDADGRVRVRRALSAEIAARRDCLAQEWPSPTRAVGLVSLETRGAALPLDQLTVRSGARITPVRLWPLAALLLGLSLWLLAPWFTRPARGDIAPVPESVARSAGGIWLAAGSFLLVMAATYTVARSLGGAVGMLAGLMVQNGLLIACSAALLNVARGGRAALGLRAPPPGWMLRAAVCAGGLLLVALATTTLLRDVTDVPIHLEIERMPNRYALMFGAVVAPIAEELYYRELVRSSLGWFHPAVGLWGQAALFALVHVQQLGSALVALIPIAMVGAVNGVLRERSGSLLPAWLVHTIYNGLLVASLATSGA